MAELFRTEHGDPGAPLVVIVHGSMDRSAAFARVQRHLEDHLVVRYDRRGYGRSIELGPPESFDVQVDDLAGVVAERPAVIVGHSLGGVVALAFAQRRPDLVRAVVAYEAPMPWQPWWPSRSVGAGSLRRKSTPEEAAEHFMRRMVGDSRWERLPERTRAARRLEGTALLADLRQVRQSDPSPYDPSKVAVPVVAAHGDESSPHHQEAARVLAELAPDAELQVVAGAGHGVHLTHPAALAGLVRRGVDRARAASPAA